MINNLFQNQDTVKIIQEKLPELFYIAELESSRAGKVGMEVGSVREKIIIALLIFKFGQENVKTDLSIHEPEIDVIVYKQPLSIKTISGKKIGAFKLIWTVDQEKATEFTNSYTPVYDILLAHINWGGFGSLSLFTKEAQIRTLKTLGRNQYFKPPKKGTNPRGVEISNIAVQKLYSDSETQTIPIFWKKKEIQFDPYKRWIEYWEQE